MRYGEELERDIRIAHIVEREKFLLSVILPRVRTFHDAMKEWCKRSTSWTVISGCTAVLLIQLTVCFTCVSVSPDLCEAGLMMEEDAEQSRTGWSSSGVVSEYGPPMVNALSILMLSFYANVCMDLYKEGYLASQALRESIFDLIALVAGTIPQEARAVRMEFWRCANLFHICTYVLADKARGTYNLDHFLIPIATAYGEWDGDTFGMLRRDELEILLPQQDLQRLAMDQRANLRPPHERLSSRSLALGRALHRAKSPGDLPVPVDHEFEELHAAKKRERNAALRMQGYPGPRRVQRNSGRAAFEKVRALTNNTRGRTGPNVNSLANSRGDTTSDAAALHAAIGVRLYQLVDLVIETKLSRAAWPAWNALNLKLRTNAEGMKQRSLYRLPRIYQAAVRFLVGSTVITDTLLLASHAGRMLRRLPDAESGEWQAHAVFSALLDLLLNLLLTWCLTVFIDAVADMQTPFGSECFDMPGLSYVCSAAELSLRMVRGGHEAPASRAHHTSVNRLFRVLTGPLDRNELLAGMPDRDMIEEEEEEDGGDE